MALGLGKTRRPALAHARGLSSLRSIAVSRRPCAFGVMGSTLSPGILRGHRPTVVKKLLVMFPPGSVASYSREQVIRPRYVPLSDC
jgi:hypothetical protein